MLGKRLFAGFVLGLFALTAPSALLADEAAAPAPARDGGYTVKQGDTLWDLSGQYLEAPANWPDLWKANPQLKDPDLIYPGETLNIPGRAAGQAADQAGGRPEGGKESGAAARETLGMQKEEPFVDMGETVLRAPVKPSGKIIVIGGGDDEKKPIASTAFILNAGFVSGNNIKTMTLAGSPQVDRVMYTLTEQVYVADDGSLKPGDRLMTFRPGATVTNPATGGSLGNIMIVSGLLDVKSRQGNYALAEVSTAFADIKITDKVVPYTEPRLVYEPIPANPYLSGKWGYVVALIDDREYNAQEGVIYLGIGSGEGVLPGDSFSIRRSGGRSLSNDGYFDPRKYVLPDVKVGDAVVLSVQPNTATAVLTSSSEPIKPGFRAYYER